MSTVDTDNLDDGIYRTTFDPSTEPPSVAIVEAIEAALGSASPDAVLADSIDPDALEQLYRDGGAGSWMLTFDHDGYELTLWASGRIHVETTPSTVSSEADRPIGRPTQPTGPAQPTGPSL